MGLILVSLISLYSTLSLAEGERITPNYKDADIRQIIEAVSEVTGQNFIIDARVKAQVTLISSTPMTPEAFYDTFLAILQVYGFVAIPAGDVVKILPDTNARQLPGNDLPRTIGNNDEIVTQVISVQNIGAAQLVPILRPLVPPYGHLAAHPSSNMLIISDRAANVNRLLRIINRIDQSGDEEIEVMRLEHASAGDLVRILTALNQGAARGDSGSSPMQIVADDRTNSILLSGDKSDRLRIKALIAHLDTPLEEGGNTQVIYLSYADAEELAGKLKEQATQAAPSQSSNTNSTNVVIWADVPTNALVITAPPKVMRSLRSVIDKLDIRRLQVQVEAILVDISIDKSAELGITWAVDSTKDTAGVAVTNFDGTTNITDIAGAALGGTIDASILGSIQNGLTYGIGKISQNGTSFGAVLRALAGDANNNILSMPSIVTMDNEEAEVSVGREVPFLTGSFSNTGGGNTGSVNPFQTIQRKDVGLMLKVTPQINEGNAVIMEIELEVSSLEQGATAAVDLVTSQRSIRQKVVVEDGGIIVLGGLIDESLLEKDSRVPGLSRLPFIGNLFKARTTNKTKRNLMVFISPTILRNSAEAFYETNSKYQYIRDQQNSGKVPLMPRENRPIMPPIEEFATPPPMPDSMTNQ